MEPLSPPSRRTVGFFQKLVLTIILAGIPGLFLSFLIDRIDENNARQAQRDEVEEMRQVLSRTAEIANLQRKFGELLTRHSFRTRYPATARTFFRITSGIRRAHAGILDLYLFDAAGKRVAFEDKIEGMVFASQKFLEALQRPDAKTPSKLIAGFAGNADAARLMRSAPSTLVDLMNGDRQTWGGWWPLLDGHGKPAGDLIAFVHRGGISPEFLVDQAVKETNRRVSQQFTCGWQDPLRPMVLRPEKSTFPGGLIQTLASIPIGLTDTVFEGRSLAIHTADKGELLFALGESRFAGAGRLGSWRWWLLSAIGICGWFIAGSLLESTSLRSRLVWNLLIAAAFPLAVFLTAVLLDSQAQEEILVRKIRETQLEQLIRLDGEMHSLFLPLLQKYIALEKMIAGAVISDGVIDGTPFRLLAKAAHGLIKGFAIIDEQGRRRFSETYRGKNLSLVAGDEIPIYATNILQAVNGEISIGSNTLDAGANPIAEMIVTTKAPWQWFDDAGIFQVNTIGKEEELSYLRIFPGRKLDFGGVFMVVHDSRMGQVRYLQKLARGKRRGSPGESESQALLAVPAAPSTDLPAFPGPATDRHEVIRAFRDRIMTAGLPCHQVSTIRGRRYLLSGLRGRLLHDYVLVLAQPLNAIQRQTAETTQRAGMLAFLGLLLAGGSAWLASRWLLTPLTDLDRGLVAVRNRDFTVRVPSGHLDELDQVAERLNHTIDSLRDLELAKTVQEHLWPASGLSGDGWQIEGRCVTAADLGGDHHDWFRLPDGRLVVALGDVAGHGIPSGLIAASAKVSLALYARSEPSPEAILFGMNRVVQEQIGRTRPMTFWLGLFDPGSRKLVYANAGQCYPIFIQAGHAPRMLETPGMPLGSVKKPSFGKGEVDLRGGGRLYLYSDGLIEATNFTGEMYGYPRMMETLEGLQAETCAQALATVFRLIHSHSGKTIPDDDQTMVILDLEPRT